MKKNLRTIVHSLFALAGVSLLGTTASAAPQEARPGEIVVQLPAGVTGSAVDALAAKVGCEVIQPIPYCPGFYLLGVKGRTTSRFSEVPTSGLTQVIATLRKESTVVSADANWIRKAVGKQQLAKPSKRGRATEPPGATITPNDTYYSRQKWDMEMIRMPEAWNIQFSNSSTPLRVAVVDTGIDQKHPDFQDPATGTTRVVAAGDFIDGQPGIDGFGHGTHVAGTIAAVTNNNTGVVGVAGWRRGGVKIELIDAKGLGASGGGTVASVASAVGFAVDNGARVINESLGGGPASTPAAIELDAHNRAMNAGVVVVAAAGNDSTDNDPVDSKFFPADIPGVIKVTAVGIDGTLTWYSNYGGNTKKIAAPGGSLDGNPDHDVLSTIPTSHTSGVGLAGYDAFAGTSMACPHVAGVAALLLAAGAPSTAVYQTMADTAKPVTPADVKKYGPGIVDAYSALFQWVDPDPAILVEGGTDRGVSYFGQTPIYVSLVGVSKIISASSAVSPRVVETDVTVEVLPLGRNASPLATYVGGRNVTGQANRFEIPVLGSSQNKSTRFEHIPVPALAADGSYSPLRLQPGQYKIVGRVRFRNADNSISDVESVQYLTVAQKSVAAGRHMFALPFRAGLNLSQGEGITPEAATLGTQAAFSLARFNPIRLPNEGDYARYRSNESGAKSAARFDIRDQVDSRVIAFDVTDLTTSVAPVGLGYWLDTATRIDIDTSRLPYPGQFDDRNPIVDHAVGIKAFASGGGWNMIGAPFTYPVEWSVATIVADGVSYSLAEAVRAGIISPALIGYAQGDYVYAIAPTGQLEPFNAYWVRVYQDCTIVIPPVPSAGVGRSLSAVATSEGWRARLVAQVAGDVDGQNYFGQMRDAKDGADGYDIPKPPAGAGHAYVRFFSGAENGKSRSLAFDLRNLAGNANRQEWNVSVSTDRPNANVVLSWADLQNAPRTARLSLKDLATGTVVPMGSRSSYTYRSGEAGSSRMFQIILEPQPSAGVLAIRNVRATPAGSTRGASAFAVRFNTNVDADIKGQIETLTGRAVGVLGGATRATAGAETTLRWDGRGTDGNVVPAGPYVVKITARTAEGQLQTVQRMIQVIR